MDVSVPQVAEDALARLAGWRIPVAEQQVTVRDCMLYGLSVGLGRDPLDPGQLRFVTEERTAVVPSMVLSLAAPGFWFKAPELGLHWQQLLNVEQSITLDAVPAPGERLRSRSEVVAIVDKGPPKGALVTWRRDLRLADTDAPRASILSTFLLRGDGRAERSVKASSAEHATAPLPARPADRTVDVATSRNSGLLYRLTGTLNPLHADPAVAAAAGFPRPIMPGTASMGWACAVLLEHCCAFRPERMRRFGARLSAPIYPGDTLRHELWHEGEGIAFRVSVPERAVVVLDRGRCDLRTGAP